MRRLFLILGSIVPILLAADANGEDQVRLVTDLRCEYLHDPLGSMYSIRG